MGETYLRVVNGINISTLRGVSWKDYNTSTPVGNNFEFTVLTTNAGSASDTFILPLIGTGYNFTVDWGDASSDVITSSSDPALTHVYSSSGTYNISITGTMPRINFGNTGDKSKILDVTSWGNVGFTTMENAFWGCGNLVVTATDSLTLPVGASMRQVFSRCPKLTADLSSWDVSNVTNLEFAFFDCQIFESDLSSWDVSSCTKFGGAFQYSYLFNSDLSFWDVSSGTSFNIMFHSATSFNGSLDNWSVSGSLTSMFFGATSFNQSLASWNTSGVTQVNSMFRGAIAFNSSVAGWDMTSVTNVSQMFYGANAFNQDVNSWVVGTTDLSLMFWQAAGFNQSITWDFSAVTNMGSFLRDTALDNANYQSMLIHITGWSGGVATKTVQTNVSAHFGTAKYEIGGNSEDARNWLTGVGNTWTITDGGGI